MNNLTYWPRFQMLHPSSRLPLTLMIRWIFLHLYKSGVASFSNLRVADWGKVSFSYAEPVSNTSLKRMVSENHLIKTHYRITCADLPSARGVHMLCNNLPPRLVRKIATLMCASLFKSQVMATGIPVISHCHFWLSQAVWLPTAKREPPTSVSSRCFNTDLRTKLIRFWRLFFLPQC